jgi:shikimate kinase
LDTNSRNIVITGFMGTGKTTVAPLVAGKLGRAYIETDEEIVRHAGKPIPEIFAEQGEPAFRQLEYEMCEHIAAQRNLVVSTGGGMLIADRARDLMVKSAFVVCLNAPPDVIEQRISGDAGRPLSGQWRELLAKRQPIYARIPYQVDTTGKLPEQIAQEIIVLWQNASA